MAAIVMGLLAVVALAGWGLWAWNVLQPPGEPNPESARQEIQRLQDELVVAWERIAEMLEIIKLPRPTPEPEPALADDLLREMVSRMLDASFPKDKASGQMEKEQIPGPDAEYEAPFEPVGDWTDPFMGLERGLVGGLRPGQGIPGIELPMDEPLSGIAASIEDGSWEGHPIARGMVPDDASEWDHAQEMGEDAFAQWQAEQMSDEGRMDA